MPEIAPPVRMPPWFARPGARSWTCAPAPAEVREFHASLPGYAPTPLIELPRLAAELGVGRVFVKDESSRLGLPAFKALGASWAVHRALAERAGHGGAADPVTLVAATDGNHGRAVAQLARLLGQRARVFVPRGVHPEAVAAIAAEQAEVTRVAGSYDDAVREAAEAAAAPDTILVQDMAWPGYERIPGWIVEGYSTLCAEIDEQVTPDLIVVPVGVGSLAQAVVTHYRSRPAGPAPALLSVESTAAPCVIESLMAGEPVSVATGETIMAGLNCGTPSSIAWPYLRGGLDAAVAVTDADSARAADDLAALGVSAGPCGAASLAGIRAALTGDGADERRAALGLGPASTVVLLSTEGRAANPTTPGRASSMPDKITVNGGRLWRSLMDLAEVGAYDDERTGLRGVNRLALTDADAEGRRLVIKWMEQAGLAVRVDRMGNIYGRREGSDPAAAPVLTGSHLDSVATAGAFDGCLGVLGGLEVVRTLNEHGITTRRPIEVCVFTEEEGVRFGTDMLGSAVAAGRLTLEYAHALTDRGGLTLGGELTRTGFDGPADVRLEPPHAYVECHIEQGPVLAEHGVEVGVVTGVQGISWQEITIHGRAAHAGTTPTHLRADAGLAAAQIIVRLRAMVDSGNYGGLRATVGHLAVHPNLTNIVPARATLTVDLRNPDDTQIAQAEEDLAAFLRSLENSRPGLTLTTRRMARTAYVSFDEDVRKAIAQAADDHGLEHVSLLSGAGHDAQEIAVLCPTAMIFVRGEYDGISHNPREYSTPEACAHGVDVLATTLLRLANQD
ncbi:diaminopropionate ammonia-lyase [Acrocarpospora pleiomorpha]|uniref:diaminopropionate ammonia-lyase n=1 Tax=Acrocarpospora pleiomorpha TaxID=90975 RepID=UPI001C3FADC1|nr:diaminopropionate ammonia-lyase [Acrocarpospora pleiomorpha]